MMIRPVFALLCLALCFLAGCGGGGSGERLREYDAATSPDGRQVAFCRQVNPGNLVEADLFLRNADGTGERKIRDTYSVSRPIWSPDGTKLVYLELRSVHDSDLTTLNLSTGATRHINFSGGLPEEWRTDGTIIFRENKTVSGNTELHRFQINEDGTGLVDLGPIP